VVTITRRAEQQLDRAAQAQRDAGDELFARLTDAQRAQLRRILLVLRERLATRHTGTCASPDATEHD